MRTATLRCDAGRAGAEGVMSHLGTGRHAGNDTEARHVPARGHVHREACCWSRPRHLSPAGKRAAKEALL